MMRVVKSSRGDRRRAPDGRSTPVAPYAPAVARCARAGARAPRRRCARAATSAANSSSSSMSGTSTSAPSAPLSSSCTGSSSKSAKSVSDQSPSPRKRGVLPDVAKSLVGRRRSAIIGHLAGGRLGPVRERYRSAGLAGRRRRHGRRVGVAEPAAGPAWDGARARRTRSGGPWGAGTGPPVCASGGASRRGRGGSSRRTAATGLDRRLRLFRAEDAHTLARGLVGGLFFEVVGHGDQG